MAKRNWTPEPWIARGASLSSGDGSIMSAQGTMERVGLGQAVADVGRTASCVNALAAVGNPGKLPELLKDLLLYKPALPDYLERELEGLDIDGSKLP